jgi:Ala-tRNA(Pro) deacylase
MSEIDSALLTILKDLGVEYSVLEHDVITTMEQGKEIMKKLDGVVPINLLMKDSTGNRYLLIKQMENKTKFGDIGKVIGAKSLQLEARTALSEVLHVPEGCATVFALLNDTEHKITVLIDSSIPADGQINFHPLRNNATLTLTYADMLRFVDKLGNPIKYF